jgi:hypothetical protein
MFRRKKCVPNIFPVCGACERLNLKCVREAPRQILPVFQSTAEVVRSQHIRGAPLHISKPTCLGTQWFSSQLSNRAESGKWQYAMKFTLLHSPSS